MIKTINDKSTINEIFFYIIGRFGFDHAETRSYEEYEYPMDLLKQRYLKGMHLLEELRKCLIRYFKGGFKQYDEVRPLTALDLLKFSINNMPDDFSQQLDSLYNEYYDKKTKHKKLKKSIDNLPWENKRKVELSWYISKYKQRFKKNDKSIIEFDFLQNIYLSELERILYLQKNKNKKNPYHMTYKRIKSPERTVEKFIRNVKAEKLINPDAKFFRMNKCYVQDLFGKKIIALNWDILGFFEGCFLYTKARENNWIIGEKKDSRLVEGKEKELGLIRYRIFKEDEGITYPFTLQFTTLTDYLLDEFFAKHSHFRYALRSNKLNKEIEEKIIKNGKSPKKFKNTYYTDIDYLLMRGKLYLLYNNFREMLK